MTLHQAGQQANELSRPHGRSIWHVFDLKNLVLTVNYLTFFQDIGKKLNPANVFWLLATVINADRK